MINTVPRKLRDVNEAIGSALVEAAAAKEPLQVDIRGTKLNLSLVKPPFVPLKKN